MKPQFKTLGIQMLGLCIACSAHAQTYNKLDPKTQHKIDSTYQALIKKYKVVGTSIAVVDNNEIVYATGYGFSDKQKQVKADEKTIYRIGSCTKSFTSLSVMQLQEKQQLNINHSLKNYLTDLKITSRFNDGNEIYIKDIMSHTSGLPCDIINGFFCDSPPDIKWVINELNKQTTIAPRLYTRAYSNVGYGLLGELIARTGKTTYSTYIKEQIFKPLQMTSSYIEHDETLAANFSKAYLNGKEIKEPLIRDQAAGLIHSNAIDMAHYVSMYLNKGTYNGTRIISEQSLKEMEQNHMDSVALNDGSNWGYGLYTEKAWLKKDKDSTVINIIGHGGDTYAFHADFAFIPELNIGVVVLTNTDQGVMVNSAIKLLRIYIKQTKSQLIYLTYKEPKKDSLVAANAEKLCQGNEVLGYYNFGNFMVNVKDTRTIKFKQGPATIKLSHKAASPGFYSVKALLYKVMPIKIKNIEMKFARRNDQIFLKQVDTKSRDEIYGAVKTTPVQIPDTWKTAYGNYKIAGLYYACKDCPYGNAEGMKLTISEQKGFVHIETKGKTPDTNDEVFLEIISNDMAVTGGIGRGTGRTVRLLNNGNIYYDGFEYTKVK